MNSIAMEIDSLAGSVRMNAVYMQIITKGLMPGDMRMRQKIMTMCKLQTERVQAVIDALMTGDKNKVECARADLTSMVYIIQSELVL